MKKPPTYAFYKRGGAGVFHVVQLRRVKGGDLLSADELQAYVVTEPIETPFHKIRIARRSVLLFAPDAVAEMLAAGSVMPLEEVDQIPWREGCAAEREKKRAKEIAKGFG